MKNLLIITAAAAVLAVSSCNKAGKSDNATADTPGDSVAVAAEGTKDQTPPEVAPDIIGLWTLNNDKKGPDSLRNQLNFGADGNGFFKRGSQQADFTWTRNGDKIYLSSENDINTHVYNILANDAKSLVIQEDGSKSNRINHFVRQ